MNRLASISFLSGLAGLAGPLASARAQWTTVDLEPAGAGYSYAQCAGGDQQGGYAAVGGFDHASLWTGTAASWLDLHPINTPTVTVSRVFGMSPNAQVGYTYNGVLHAALWTGSAASWVDLQPDGAQSSAAYGVSGSLQVGRVTAAGFDSHASVWTGGAVWTDINPSTIASDSVAYAVSDGQIVGFMTVVAPPATSHAALWNGATASAVDLNPAGATASWAYGVQGGQQVGYVQFGGQHHAALWSGSAGSFVDLNIAGQTESRAWAVYGGQQVGYTAASTGVFHAALWTGTAASHVDLHAVLPPGFSSSTAQGIWSGGGFTFVAGYGTNFLTGNDEPLLWKMATPCYANCDASTSVPILNANDFQCFLNQFAAGNTAANCDGSTAVPVLTANDFQCFLNTYAAGCP